MPAWRSTILAALASYVDAGSIVAGAAGLTLWAQHFGLSSSTVGLIGAFSSNAISAGVGALVGGWLCDRFGRRRIFQWDLLLYAFGLLWIIFAVQPWMLIVGYVFTGLAVGADVPASWTLIAEIAPKGARGRHSGVAQLLWGVGPLVVLLMALALSGAGLLGIRLVFVPLFVVAIVLFVLRRRVDESPDWERERVTTRVTLRGVRQLFSREHLAPLLLLGGMYGIWNLKAGTSGFFMPYILRTVGAQTQAESLAIQASGFVLGCIGAYVIFMRHVDHANQRRMFAAAIMLEVAAMLLFATLPLTTGVAIAYVLLGGAAGGFGPQPFFMLWSAESFPTMLRATALGLMFAVVRISLGIWSYFVPTLTASGFHTLALLLGAFVAISGALGLTFASTRRRAGNDRRGLSLKH
jgi:inositol transporter-like SP family MFS transporter